MLLGRRYCGTARVLIEPPPMQRFASGADAFLDLDSVMSAVSMRRLWQSTADHIFSSIKINFSCICLFIIMLSHKLIFYQHKHTQASTVRCTRASATSRR